MPYVIKDQVDFLSEASKILSDSLDYNSTLSNIAKLIVDSFGDLCIIDVLEKRKMVRVAVRVSNLKQQPLADKFFTFPPNPGMKKDIYDGTNLRKPIVIKRVTKNSIRSVSKHPKERELVQELKMNSIIFAPMTSRKRLIGVLTIASSNPDFSYSKDDIQLADELANRAGIAVDKSRLFTEAQDAIKTRDLFISLASHELKTPITTMYVYLQLIQKNIEKNKKFDPNWVKTLIDEMIRLTKIVDNLLEISNIRTGKLNYDFEEVNIKEIIRRALVNFQANHKNKVFFGDNIEDKEGFLVADFDKVMQVFINILDNAAKHSPSGKPIKIILESEGKYIVVKIVDEGHGIPESDIEKVFQGFYKTADNTRPGMGLGLYLSKEIIDAHKGKIEVKSKVGEGSSISTYLRKL